jgi:hypothetical protein
MPAPPLPPRCLLRRPLRRPAARAVAHSAAPPPAPSPVHRKVPWVGDKGEGNGTSSGIAFGFLLRTPPSTFPSSGSSCRFRLIALLVSMFPRRRPVLLLLGWHRSRGCRPSSHSCCRRCCCRFTPPRHRRPIRLGCCPSRRHRSGRHCSPCRRARRYYRCHRRYRRFRRTSRGCI